MRRTLIFVLIFIGLLAVPILARYLRYYNLTGSDREQPPVYEPADVPAMVPTPQAADYRDDPDQTEGSILLDMAHNNAFTLDELSELDRGLSARGMEFSIFEEGDLGSALRTAKGFVVVAPLTEFTDDEVRAVADFVANGGRLLLVGDPTRYTVEEDEIDPFEFELSSDEIPLNSLGNAFEIVFNGDYLYNTIENEGNFRNIILDLEDTRSSLLTDELEALAFYGAHSVSVGPNGSEILPADENTWSSATHRPGGLTVAVMAADAQMDPVDLPTLLAPLIAGDADYVKGNRLAWPEASKAMPWHRWLGNRVLSFLTSVAIGVDVGDSQCGYVSMNRSTLRALPCDRLWTGYGYPNDWLSWMVESDLRLCEVPVRPIYGEERSGITLRHVVWTIPFVIARAWLRRYLGRSGVDVVAGRNEL